MQQRFWLVWCPEHGLPKMKHETLNGAILEAKRLAANASDNSTGAALAFYVLEAVGVAHRIEVKYESYQGISYPSSRPVWPSN